MTVDTTSSRVQENGNGVKTAFTFTFKTLAVADLEVYKVDTTTGISTLQTLTTDYTVVLNTVTDGGTVTYVVAPTSSPLEQSLIIRVMTIDQQTDIPTASNIPEEALEDAYDKGIMISQQVQEQVDRSLVLDVGSTATGITVPSPVANKALIWNSAGDNLENSTDDYEDQAANSAASAAAALVSEGNAATSATAASSSASSASSSATAAANSAAGVNLPSIQGGDVGKILEVNTGETGYDLVSSSAWKTIKNLIISSDASLEFEDGVSGVILDSTFDEYQILIRNYVPGTDNTNLLISLSVDGGTTPQSCLSRREQGNSNSTAAVVTISAGATTTMIAQVCGSATGEGLDVDITLGNLNSALHKNVHWEGTNKNADGFMSKAVGYLTAPSTSVIDSITFTSNSGNLGTGNLILQGRVL